MRKIMGLFFPSLFILGVAVASALPNVVLADSEDTCDDYIARHFRKDIVPVAIARKKVDVNMEQALLTIQNKGDVRFDFEDRVYFVVIETWGVDGRFPSAVEPGAKLVEGPYVAETLPVTIDEQYVVVEMA